MKISVNGVKFISREEGEVLHVYLDQVGVPTIGVGHALKTGSEYPHGITHEQAMDILQQDLVRFEASINSHVKVELTQNMFDALCSFAFNLGSGAFEGSTLLKLLNQGLFDQAASEFPKWCHAGGKVNQVILNRRLREQKLFLTPEAQQVTFIEHTEDLVKAPVPDKVLPPETTPVQPPPSAWASIASFFKGGKQ